MSRWARDNQIVLIRTATIDDVEPLASLAARTFPLACPSHVSEADIAELVSLKLSSSAFADYINDDASITVADLDGNLVGYAMTFMKAPDDEQVASALRGHPSVELSKFYTDASIHGRGIASELMASVIEQAETRGAESIWLGVNVENVRAQKFYAKHGFVVVGKRNFYLGSRVENDYVMERLV